MCDGEPCWLFLQGTTRNFAHPALKHLIIDFFYTGTYRIAQQCADIFCHRIPFQCLTLASTAVILKHFTAVRMLTTIQFNCVLDGFVKDGRGKHMPLFLGKNYGSIYLGILGLVEKMAKDSYHGLWLQSQLAEWAQDAWYIFIFGLAEELISYNCTGGQCKLRISISRGTTIWRSNWTNITMLITWNV